MKEDGQLKLPLEEDGGLKASLRKDGALKGSLEQDGGLKASLQEAGLHRLRRLLRPKSRLTPALPASLARTEPAYAGFAGFFGRTEPAYAG